MVATPEGKIKAQINKLLDSYGESVYTFKPVQMGYGAATIDYLVCVDGLFLGIEAKRKKARVVRQSRQEGVIEDIRKAGGTVFVVASEDDVNVLRRFIDGVMHTASLQRKQDEMLVGGEDD